MNKQTFVTLASGETFCATGIAIKSPNKKPAIWRESYEAFRGRVWEWSTYRIQEDGPCYTAFHSGQRASTSASLYELQLACEGRLA